MTIYYRTNREYESNLSEARCRAGLTVKEFCEQTDISPQMYVNLNNGISSPIGLDGKIKPVALRIQEFLNEDLSDIWPRYFCSLKTDDLLTDDQKAECSHPGLFSNYYADPEQKLLRKEKSYTLRQLLSILSRKHRFVLTSYCIYNLNFVEIGEELKLTRSRVQQIYKEAIRKLRRNFFRIPNSYDLFKEDLSSYGTCKRRKR